VWNAHRIEIGQNGQNGHSLDSEGDFVPTQMKRFLKCLVSAMECLCRCLTSQKNSLHYTALNNVRVECPPHWNRTKRTKRTLTGIGRRLRVHPNELLFYALCIGNGMPMHMCHLTKPISYYTALIKVKDRVECPPLWNRTKRTKRIKRTKRTLTGLKNRVRANPSELLSHALCIGPGMPM